MEATLLQVCLIHNLTCLLTVLEQPDKLQILPTQLNQGLTHRHNQQQEEKEEEVELIPHLPQLPVRILPIMPV